MILSNRYPLEFQVTIVIQMSNIDFDKIENPDNYLPILKPPETHYSNVSGGSFH